MRTSNGPRDIGQLGCSNLTGIPAQVAQTVPRKHDLNQIFGIVIDHALLQSRNSWCKAIGDRHHQESAVPETGVKAERPPLRTWSAHVVRPEM